MSDVPCLGEDDGKGVNERHNKCEDRGYLRLLHFVGSFGFEEDGFRWVEVGIFSRHSAHEIALTQVI